MAEKMKRSGNFRSRRMTYIKRRESVLKQAAELSMFYHIDVGLMMFSPTGQFTSFAHKGRVEDIFLRYLDHNDEHKECFLYESLKRLKYEAEILDKLGRYHALERKLTDLNWKKYEAENKMRSYNPDMTKILTISEADLHQQFVMEAILRIEKLKVGIFPLNKKLLEQEVSPAKPNHVEMSGSTAEGSASSGTQRTQLAYDHNDENIEQPEPSASEGHILEVQVS
ncbi:agamous-like MADS-box protein AGL66 [Gossypium australe]|uniref:Agamous-like MADS-box protein AGL66 n=1 Tax=Gossypium australe TaxID=47621 RepID=A0A5B6X587_9ROSI|nr:agamous-like MADS-box protein AGL66 [Gossypium australe]